MEAEEISLEYRNMMRGLHERARPSREEWEFTLKEYFEVNSDRLKTIRHAESELDKLVRDGELIKPPKRYINGHLVKVWREKFAV